jgi:hypothetical protein
MLPRLTINDVVYMLSLVTAVEFRKAVAWLRSSGLDLVLVPRGSETERRAPEDSTAKERSGR